MRHPKIVTPLVLCAGLATSAHLASCASDPQRGFVQQEWTKTLRELGIRPLFPPREDVMVGDIYLSSHDPNSLEVQRIFEARYDSLNDRDKVIRNQIGMASRLMRLDLACTVSDGYRNTPAFSATTDEYATLLGGPETPAMDAHLAGLKKNLESSTKVVKDAETALKQALDDERNLPQLTRDAEEKQRQYDAAVKDERLAVDILTARQDEFRRVQQAHPPESDQYKKAEADVKTAQANRNERGDEVTLKHQSLIAAKDRVALANERITKKPVLQTAVTEAKSEETKANSALDNAKTVLKSVKGLAKDPLPRQPRSDRFNVYTGNPLPGIEAPGNNEADPGNKERPTSQEDLNDSRVNRLRLVGFPEFSYTTLNQAEFAALVPIEAFVLGVQADYTKVRSVNVKVPVAESYAVPLNDLQKSLYTPDDLQEDQIKLESQAFIASALRPLRWPLTLPLSAWEDRTREIAADLVCESSKISTPMTRDSIECIINKHVYHPSRLTRSGMERAILTVRPLLRDYKDRVSRIKASNGQNKSDKAHAPKRFSLKSDILEVAEFQAQRDEGTIASDLSGTSRYFYLSVITEVFYARVMEIGVSTKVSNGMRAQLELAFAPKQPRQSFGDEGRPIKFDPQNPTSSAAPITKDPRALTNADLLAATQARLQSNLSVPGGTVQLVGFSDTFIGLRRVWERPIAIGFRGLTIKVDRVTGEVSSVETSGGMTPFNAPDMSQSVRQSAP